MRIREPYVQRLLFGRALWVGLLAKALAVILTVIFWAVVRVFDGHSASADQPFYDMHSLVIDSDSFGRLTCVIQMYILLSKHSRSVHLGLSVYSHGRRMQSNANEIQTECAVQNKEVPKML